MHFGVAVACNVYQPVSCMKLPGVGVSQREREKVDGVDQRGGGCRWWKGRRSMVWMMDGVVATT